MLSEVGLEHRAKDGVLRVTSLDAASSLSCSVTTKRGARSLYYEADLRMAWEATGAKTTTAGVLRVYNIAHETRFQLGGDPNTSYMYQLGWAPGGLASAWVESMRAEAAELFDCVAGAVDTVLVAMRAKLSERGGSS